MDAFSDHIQHAYTSSIGSVPMNSIWLCIFNLYVTVGVLGCHSDALY